MKPRAHKVLVIIGPTSSGKSALAIEFAKEFDGEVISADSRQVYRGLDVGTGKVTEREMRGVRHHLLDVASARRTFTAHDFALKASAALSEIAARGKLPIIAGGTGFYIDALLGRVSLPQIPANIPLRKKLAGRTPEELYAQLRRTDPRRAKSMNTRSERNNKVRLIRALEIAHARRPRSMPEVRSRPSGVLWVGIRVPKTELDEKIRARLIARLRRGMIAEAKRLHAHGLSYKRMEELGLEYRSLARFLQGKIARVQMIGELDRAIRNYAKRQVTYWKRNGEIRWFEASQRNAMRNAVRAWLTR